MIRAISAFLDFCYLVWRSTISQTTLQNIQDALDRFHRYRPVFQKTGVRESGPKGFSLPRQHALKHYIEHIIAFGAPNGLCSSITESMHIRSVKKPWRRSSRFKPLGQILLANQRLSKLAGIRRSFERCGMLQDDCHMSALKEAGLVTPESETGIHFDEANGITNENDDCGPVDGPQVLNHVVLARKKGKLQTAGVMKRMLTVVPQFLAPKSPKNADGLTRLVGHDVMVLIRRFLFDQKYPDSEIPGSDINLSLCPRFSGTISVYHSAVATYYAPSDSSGVGGMYRERIRANPAWNRGESPVP